MKSTKHLAIFKMPNKLMTAFSGEREFGENEM
jgi:hypothetical protein